MGVGILHVVVVSFWRGELLLALRQLSWMTFPCVPTQVRLNSCRVIDDTELDTIVSVSQ
jgi:hypothetical protein